MNEPSSSRISTPEPRQKSAKTGLVTARAYDQHQTGPDHPESPSRCHAITKALANAGLGEHLVKLEPRAATEEELLLCHTERYVATVKRDVTSGEPRLSTGDTVICEKSYQVALLAVGGVCSAVDAVARSAVKNAFCVVRPPGHHATPSRGMGFCIFNNLAVAARYAQKKHNLARVLIVDWDVHHGNGTQEIFYHDGSVFYFSTHQSHHYPGTGRAEETGSGEGEGCNLNFPLPEGTDGSDILRIFKQSLVPAADRFRPDLVLVSAGFDSRTGDSLGGFQLTAADFAELTAVVADIARDHANGRLVSALEGGYDLHGLGTAAAAHVRALTEA